MLEVSPFKSKRSLLLAGIYRPPSYSKSEDSCLEANIEQAYSLNKKTILLGDFNIDFKRTRVFDKHRLTKELRCMNFKQLVNAVTRPVSGSCLDHIWNTRPQRIKSISCYDVGLADHLPVFIVRKFAKGKNLRSSNGVKFVRYRNMKTFRPGLYVEFPSNLIRRI